MQTNLNKEKAFFIEYTDSFLEKGNSTLNENINLKKAHSLRVTDHAIKLAKSLKLDAHSVELAGIIGLYHDIGRFTQYRDYHTFSDKDSIYHGDLGIKVLQDLQKPMLFSSTEWKIILTAIHNHGLPKIEPNLNEEALLFSKIIRDADKMDIFYIVDAYYKSMLKGKRNVALELGLKNEDKLSEGVFKSFMNEEIILKSDMQFINDFKVLQAAWIFDLNFEYTKHYIRETDYLQSIISQITVPDKRALIKVKAENYLASSH
ncbi:MAG: HD domain-containing protein [Bacteroidales bacterium]|jgi:putative nucleotidyltransferase with HDIG domain|nr:HD domain-containing protein [Bacteroidales bacterium]